MAGESLNGVGKGKLEQMPAGFEDWPTLGEAANISGITRARLTEYMKRGFLTKHIDPKGKGPMGTYRVNPVELERLQEEVAEEDAKREAPTTADVVRASVEGLKQAQAHAERLVTLFHDPYKHVLDTLQKANDSQREELALMRAERAAMHKQAEEQRSAAALENMVLTELKGEQDTKREAIELAKKVLGPMAAKHFGIVDPKMTALQEALGLIPRESFEVLFKMGVLPTEAEAKLKVGLDWKDEPAPAAAPAPAPATETAPAQTEQP